jgi:hypothetical protein
MSDFEQFNSLISLEKNSKKNEKKFGGSFLVSVPLRPQTGRTT